MRVQRPASFHRRGPRAMYLALGIATVIHIAVALGVFGTRTVDRVIASSGTALAVQPVLGQLGSWLMTITALFSTSGATNAGLYPAARLCEQLATTRQFPPQLGARLANRAPAGLLRTAAIAVVLAVGFDLTSIASSAGIALIVFGLVTVGQVRVHNETGGRAWVLILATACTLVVLVAFTFTTLIHEAGIAVAMVVIVLLSVAADFAWRRSRAAATRSNSSLIERRRVDLLESSDPTGCVRPTSFPEAETMLDAHLSGPPHRRPATEPVRTPRPMACCGNRSTIRDRHHRHRTFPPRDA